MVIVCSCWGRGEGGGEGRGCCSSSSHCNLEREEGGRRGRRREGVSVVCK